MKPNISKSELVCFQIKYDNHCEKCISGGLPCGNRFRKFFDSIPEDSAENSELKQLIKLFLQCFSDRNAKITLVICKNKRVLKLSAKFLQVLFSSSMLQFMDEPYKNISVKYSIASIPSEISPMVSVSAALPLGKDIAKIAETTDFSDLTDMCACPLDN